MIHVRPNHFSDPTFFSAAAAPPFPTISGKGTQSISFTSTTNHKLPLNTKYQLSSSLQRHYSLNRSSTISQYLFLSAFSVALLILRLTSSVILPDFSHRWRQLIAFSSLAEAELIDAPDYLFDAAVAYEDRRFFSHFGVDAIGVARAVLSLSARGGGSTITQQLVKNTLLKNERTFLRKFVEMVLAVALERRISKLRILSAYLCKIYWGHGIYGINSASKFYFGKHPSLLTLGECALLVGMIPAPEVRSPFRDYSRGKTFQTRVLKRMVDGRFLNLEAALSAMRISDSLKVVKAPETLIKLGLKDSWEWETESSVWEVREEMEKWAMSFTAKEFERTSDPTTKQIPSKKDGSRLLLSVLHHPVLLLKLCFSRY
ncbi:monofunctional glycosyltransferase-like [Salvia hispanica]|uniref:monofunctional glycosyltransferase-like n=1 Tax=Salvia hispanica TaxID=49212 RepID=UPI002009530C|nr:monofunctional glycosyltransferase-like [Salvia hispanica]